MWTNEEFPVKRVTTNSVVVTLFFNWLQCSKLAFLKLKFWRKLISNRKFIGGCVTFDTFKWHVFKFEC